MCFHGSFLSAAKLPASYPQQPQQQNSLISVIQECVDAITEHQRLHSLMKGELVKGLLPQTSVRADYTVQRIKSKLLISETLIICLCPRLSL